MDAPPEYEQYPTAEVVESREAVALVAAGVDVGTQGIRRAIGHVHRVEAALRQTLGSRVLVGLDGNAGQAIRTARRAQPR